VLRYIPVLGLAAALCAGCVVKEDIKDGLRELRPSMKSINLSTGPDGASELNFVFHYEMGLVDEAGVSEVRWFYALVDRDKNVLASHEQRMRKPDEDKTEILVQGDRTRRLDVDPGLVQPDVTYILWVSVFYRGELIGEHLSPVVDGPPPAPGTDTELPDSPDQTPDGGLPPTVTEI
jgi:hypothetical protein